MKVHPFKECQNCSPVRFDCAVDLAKEIEELGAEKVEVGYSAEDDFMWIGFEVKGVTYNLWSYKILALTFDNKRLRFNGRHEFVRFFRTII